MSFLWPEMLWLYAALPLLVAAYFYALSRKKKLAVRYASLTLVKEAMGKGQAIAAMPMAAAMASGPMSSRCLET